MRNARRLEPAVRNARRPACRRHWWWRWHWRWNWRRHCRWSCISWTPVHPLWRAGRHRDCNLVARHGTLARHDWVQEQPGTLLPGRGHSALSWCKGRLRAKAQRRRGHSTRHAPRCRSLAQRRALTRGFKARRKFFGPGQSPRNGRDFHKPHINNLRLKLCAPGFAKHTTFNPCQWDALGRCFLLCALRASADSRRIRWF